MKQHKSSRGQRLGLFHQVSDYAVALGFLVLITRATYPLLLALLGLVALLNAATTQGPVAAYRLVPHKIHSGIDMALVLGAVVAGCIGSQSTANRFSLFALALIQGFIIYLTRVTKHARL
ncbi:MAG: hypothetical protein EBY23_08355 [Actinobacteria bacterium]|nr:hypothetical protein [Actinomycetota bacterium]